MPIKLANVNIMSQLTSRGLDNTSSAFVSDIYISIYISIYIFREDAFVSYIKLSVVSVK